MSIRKDTCKHCGKYFLHKSHAVVSYCSKECLGHKKIWNKGLSGKQPWMNLSGLKPHKRGEYKHTKETIEKISKSKKGSIAWNKGISGEIKISCKQCNKEFLVQPSQLSYREPMFCSRTCKALFYKEAGLNSKRMKKMWSNKEYREMMIRAFEESTREPWNKGIGITPEEKRVRGSKEYSAWRKIVLFRDSVCQFCGSDEDLQAHHIDKFSDNQNRRTDILNGISLCKNCHLFVTNNEKEWSSYFNFIIDNNLYSVQ